jgi:hypothetical protein
MDPFTNHSIWYFLLDSIIFWGAKVKINSQIKPLSFDVCDMNQPPSKPSMPLFIKGQLEHENNGDHMWDIF